MSKSNLYGSSLHGHPATIAMIEHVVRARAIRRSKIAFWTIGTTVTLATTVVAFRITTPLRALLVGLVSGAILGFCFALVLFVWPAIRVLWHWAFEVTLFAGVLAGYLALTSVLPWPAALAVLTTIVGGPFAWPSLRRRLWAWVMCAVSRHRLRACFAAVIASQRHGHSPLILLARPIPAGERIWIWLRPGLALADLEDRLDRFAAGCWAAECRIAPASRRYSALLRLDIARRNPLTTMVGSPLPDLIPAMPIDPTAGPTSVGPPHGLDLPDTPELPTEPTFKRRLAVTATTPPSQPAPAAETKPADDLSHWI